MKEIELELELIPVKEALDLKELGFDEECLTSYRYDGRLMDMWSAMGFVTNSSLKDPKQFNANSNSKLLKDYVDNPFTAAPLYQQAFRWCREKYDKYGVVNIDLSNNLEDKIFVYIIEDKLGYIINRSEEYKTYEEAKLACLQQLIKIVKDEKCI